MPLYQQAKRQMLDKLQSKQWKPGDKLPAEPRLAASLGVSIGTLRHAVSELVDEGVLRRIQGSGTIIESYGGSGYWNRFQPFQTRDGRPLYLKERIPISCETIPAPEAIASKLSISPGTPVFHVLRALWEEKFFVGTDELFLREDYFTGFTLELFRSRLAPDESLYAFYEREYGVRILETSNFVSCEMNCGQLFQDIDAPELAGAPICLFKRVSRTYGHVPVEVRVMSCDFRKVQLSFDL